jgi:hypothetical protein
MTGRQVLALYVVLVVPYGVFLARPQSHSEASRMMESWVVLKDEVEVPAKPTGLWTLALEWADGPALIKFEASDDYWFYSESDASKCSADGHLSSLLPAKACLLPTAPVGALIGKIGGSSAAATDGTVFVVGKFCIIEIAESRGPIYLTMNDEVTGFANNRGSVRVKISSRTFSSRTAPEKLSTSPGS